MGHGFIFSGQLEERILPGWQLLKRLLDEEERPLAGFGAEYLVSQSASVQEVLALARRWEDVGGTHLGIRTMGLGFTEAAQHIEFLAEVKQRLA
jgi:hypothetical protein